jgi:hypothetical protein
VFDPSQHDVRRFFCETQRKRIAGEPLTPLESIAADWIGMHPEYHTFLDHPEQALDRQFDAADGRGNPFLHLSMHLAIAEQLSIDQPKGIREAWQRLAGRLGDEHAAAHEVMECLGQVLWEAQRNHRPPDGVAYLECLLRRSAARPNPD